MAARLLVAVVALLAAADGQNKSIFDWQGPARSCTARRSSAGTVDCELPSANLTLVVGSTDDGGLSLLISCQQNSTLVCEELLREAQPLVEQYVARVAGQPLLRLQLTSCALPSASLRCPLKVVGGADVFSVMLHQARSPLLAEHVAGLVAVLELQIDYDKDEGAAIHDVPWDALRELPALRTFRLRGAALRLPALPAGAPLPLQWLDLSTGTLTALPAGAFRLAPNLTSLDLHSNYIETVHEDAFAGLSQLYSVSLFRNRVSSLPAALFRDTTRLSHLDLSDNELGELPAGVLNGLDQFTNLAALPARLLHGVPLQILLLYNNPLRLLPPELLHEQRVLQELDLANTSLEELPEELFQHADSLRVLRLTRNSLRALGKTLFKGAPSLQELYLDHNQLENLQSSLNLTEPPLGGANVRIDLRGNRLHEVPVELLRSNCSLLLADNPLNCGCSAQAGIAELLRSQEQQLVEDYSALRCAAGDALPSPSELAAVCSARSWMALGLVLGALALTTAVLAFAAHRYRAELRILLRRLGLWRADDDNPYQYDAFVSFAHQDQQFVVEQLVPRLEAGPRPLRLCLHYRDWVVGEFIPAQITSSVERSRRTIVVLSRHFLRSVWAQLEFRAAHGRSRLVLLLLDAELAADRSLDPELRAYITVNTYVRADDPLVWGRLRDAVLVRRRTFAERLGPERPVPAAPPPSTDLTANLQM